MGGRRLRPHERLSSHLGVAPGAVSILALVNDTACAVELVIDRDVWSAGAVLAHPLVNTATLVLPLEGLQRFLRDCAHEPRVIDVPVAS